MGERQKTIEERATKFYGQIKEAEPSRWFEIVTHLHLLALRDHYGYMPRGLDPQERDDLKKMMAEVRATKGLNSLT